MKYEMK